MIRRKLIGFLVSIAALLLFFPATGEAGPPLVCRQFDIGEAESLPWESGKGNSARQDYDRSRLVQDTVALLNRDNTPVIVRMETLRRAVLYAKEDQRISKELVSALLARDDNALTKRRPNALVEFDAGYLAETFKQATMTWKKLPNGKYEPVLEPNAASNVDGYARVLKAIDLRGGDPQMEFAAALITGFPHKESHDEHVRRATAGAADDSLLAKNIAAHFSNEDRAIGQRTKKQASSQ